MLTRLAVSGFKNLVEVDVWFGPFTCLAGPNGVGKSNLLDALRFLSALANGTFADAALSIRGAGRAEDIAALFYRSGTKQTDRITFEAEMIVPRSGIGDLAEAADATATYLRYRLELGLRSERDAATGGPMELLAESLVSLSRTEAKRRLLFPRISNKWLASVLYGADEQRTFISTSGQGSDVAITSHGEPGRPETERGRPAHLLSRTILSAMTADIYPTAFLARAEMRSWSFLHLEPSALRQPDEDLGERKLGPNGSHLPSALQRLATVAGRGLSTKRAKADAEARAYAEVASRLRGLVDGVRDVSVARDTKRRLLTVNVTDASGAAYPASSLSDGTLRFLALAVLSLWPETDLAYRIGLVCIEEPENGLFPDRIPALIRVLSDMATDVTVSTGPDNPLRQVIITTHSPAVVASVPDDSLLIAQRVVLPSGQGRSYGVVFAGLPDTWRQRAPGAGPSASLGSLLAYLLPPSVSSDIDVPAEGNNHPSEQRIVDREDLRWLGLTGRSVR